MLTVTKFRAPRAAGSSTAIAATSAPAAPAAAFTAGPSSVDLNDWSSTCSATEHVSAHSCSRDSPYGLQLRAMTHRLGIQGLVDQRFLVLRQRLVQVLVVLIVRPILRQRRKRRRQSLVQRQRKRKETAVALSPSRPRSTRHPTAPAYRPGGCRSANRGAAPLLCPPSHCAAHRWASAPGRRCHGARWPLLWCKVLMLQFGDETT